MRLLLAVLLISCPIWVIEASNTGENPGGLHTQEWFSVTFNDIAEDIADSADEGKRLAIVFEQRDCHYCAKMHETMLIDPKVSSYIKEHFNIIQINILGDKEVTDTNGDVMTEKVASARWGASFTPTILFMPEAVPDGEVNALEAAVAGLPGGFDKMTLLHTFQWVHEKGYEGDEPFQQYHARKLAAGK